MSFFTLIPLVAAGLRCTLANSAYNANELAYQYRDSTARLILTTEAGLHVVRQMLKSTGLSVKEADARIVILGADLTWAGGPSAPKVPEASGLLYTTDLLNRGTLPEEVKVEGDRAHETAYLCYSSGEPADYYGIHCSSLNFPPRHHRQAQRSRG